ncbi:MAG: glycosyltransferase family 4 protein [Terracidiphilus sp.]
MLVSVKSQPANDPDCDEGLSPHIVVGITSPQTCMVLTGRLRTLREAGFRVTLVCSPGELFDRLTQDERVEKFAVPMERCIAPFADIVSIVRLWLLLRRIKPDITEFSTPKAGLLGTLAARFAGVPHRVYMLRGLRLETASGLKRTILMAAERMASACAHVVLCNSESLRAKALALRLAPASKLKMLGTGSSNGVDIVRFSPGESDVRERFNLPNDAAVLGFVGRMTRDKGLPELIEAFDLILQARPEAYLLLVGWFDASEDALDAQLRASIEKHSRIICTGYVEDTSPYYRAMNMLILPTWREGFPNAVLEASATGIPVITTLSTGACDAVVPEVTGFLIPPGHPMAICEAALKFLRDPVRSQEMGVAARARVIEHFANAHILGLAARFYKDLLKPSSGQGVSQVAAMDSVFPLR